MIRNGTSAPAALLILVAVCCVVRTASGADALHDYVGVEKCKTCHGKELMGDQVGQLREGAHQRAYETLASERSVAIAKQLGLAAPATEAQECLRCHVTAFGVSPVRIANPVLPADGVQCESCHGPGRDYRKKKIMSDAEKARAKGLWDAANDAAICTACHNPESPTWDPNRYQLADGTTAGFDFAIAKDRIAHPIPEHVKGNFIELEKKQKAEEKARKGR